MHRAPRDYPSGKVGDVITVEFTVCGVACTGLNGGPAFPQSEAFAFQIAIVGNGGTPSAGGRCRVRGLSPGTSPRALTDAITRGSDVAARAFAAMMTTLKRIVAAIETAVRDARQHPSRRASPRWRACLCAASAARLTIRARRP